MACVTVTDPLWSVEQPLLDAAIPRQLLTGKRLWHSSPPQRLTYSIVDAPCASAAPLPPPPSRSFGELALMYNCERAATVQSTEECTTWVMGLRTFRRLLATTASGQVRRLRRRCLLQRRPLRRRLLRRPLRRRLLQRLLQRWLRHLLRRRLWQRRLWQRLSQRRLWQTIVAASPVVAPVAAAGAV
jgi:Cyclic nucleotide-binding domain